MSPDISVAKGALPFDEISLAFWVDKDASEKLFIVILFHRFTTFELLKPVVQA